MGLFERTRTVELMPQGFTSVEAEAEAAYRLSIGDPRPVEIDNELQTVEVTERTSLGRAVDLGKKIVAFVRRGEQ